MTHALIAREHGLDNLFTRIGKFLILKFHKDDGNATLAHRRHRSIFITATNTECSLLVRHLEGFVLHRQVTTLGPDKGILGSRALASLMGTNSRQSCQRRGVVEITVITTGYRQAITGEDTVVKSITDSLHLQGGAIALGHRLPPWLGGHCYSSNAKAQECQNSE